jgi:hypothetical protein
MGSTVALVLAVALYGGLAFVVISGWVRWSSASKQRGLVSFLSLVGFALGTASALLAIGSASYAQAIRGFRYYDPTLLRIYRGGLMLSLSGFAAGVGGAARPNTLRWFAPVLSFSMFVLWVLWAAGE